MAAQNPDSESLELITRHQRALYGYILSLVLSRDAADDVLQDTNVVLCRKIHEFDGRVSFLTWACTIAKFEVLAARKRSQRDRLVTIDDNLLNELSSLAFTEAATADERMPLLRQCMNELPEPQRKMVDQRYLPGGSVAAIAKSLGRTPASVRVSLHRSRRRLLECIERKLAAQNSE